MHLHRSLVGKIDSSCAPGEIAGRDVLSGSARHRRTLQAQRRIAYDVPRSHAALRALELDAYRALPRHPPGLIVQAVGIDPSQEEELLAALKAAGLIHQRRGKWESVRVLTVDTRADPEADLRLKAHWAAIGLDRLRRAKPNREALFSYKLCAVSRSDFSKMRALHLEYYERVSSKGSVSTTRWPFCPGD